MFHADPQKIGKDSTRQRSLPSLKHSRFMAKINPKREEIIAQDIADLRRLGYTQQLFREMGGFSNFAVSFSIISVLTGAVLLYGYGLKLAGPVINTVGWPVVSVFTLCV